MNHALFKKTVNWLGIVILFHLAATLLFAIVMASSVESIAKDAPMEAYGLVFAFDIVLYVVFNVFVKKFETSYADYRRNLKNASKEENFTLVNYYKQNFLKEDIIRCVVLVIFQLPFALFYGILGLSMTATTSFEKFYIVDAGAYGISGSSIAGLLINVLLISVIYFAISIISLLFVYLSVRSELDSLH